MKKIIFIFLTCIFIVFADQAAYGQKGINCDNKKNLHLNIIYRGKNVHPATSYQICVDRDGNVKMVIFDSGKGILIPKTGYSDNISTIPYGDALKIHLDYYDDTAPPGEDANCCQHKHCNWFGSTDLQSQYDSGCFWGNFCWKPGNC